MTTCPSHPAAPLRCVLAVLALAPLLGGCGGDGAATSAGVAVVPAGTTAPVAAPPSVTIAFDTAEIAAGGTARLSWNAVEATACTAADAWSGSRPATGSLSAAPAAAGTHRYTLSCTGPGGTASAAATLTVRGGWSPPYGLYVGNPHGNDAAAMARFQSDWDASVRQLGRAPQFFGTFTDFSKDWADWKANASWFAWSFNKSQRVKDMKPVIGIKLSTNAYWNRQRDAFREIIAGTRDQVYRDVVTAWRDEGFTELRFRISYEFNGSFMPDNFGNTAETLDLWKRAFAHVADVMHAVPGVKVLVVWNPANINWSGNSVAAAYPGDRYVDVIASDFYSPLYPLGLNDWSGGPRAANIVEWARNPANRIHFWDYPGATEWTKPGNGWGMVQALDFALARRKPFGIGETGVGGEASGKTGPADDPEMPAYLRTRLADFVAKGGSVDHVVIWDYDASDGKWRFTGVPGKAATAAAWTAFVGR